MTNNLNDFIQQEQEKLRDWEYHSDETDYAVFLKESHSRLLEYLREMIENQITDAEIRAQHGGSGKEELKILLLSLTPPDTK